MTGTPGPPTTRTTARSAAATASGIARDVVRRGQSRLDRRLFPTLVAGHAPTARLALTYDDGPTPDLTDVVAETLAAHGHRATFFVLVPQAEAHPHLVRRLLDLGHEVGLHGVAHERLPGQPWSAVHRQLRDGRDRLAAIGARPTLFRPPYGAQNRRTYLLTRAAGLRPVAWNADVRDYQERGPDAVREQLAVSLRPGAVVLLHDGAGERPGSELTADQRGRRLSILDRTMALLAERALTSVPVSELSTAGALRGAWLSA